MTTRSPARQMLLPLSPLYLLGLGVRELRLRRGWEPVRRLRYPVISIGNLSTGGAGKTPFAIALARALSVRGFFADVLSRGYGRGVAVGARVDPSGTPDEFGDEPLLIAREAGVPVYVARERYEAGLLAEELPSGAKAPGNIADQDVRAEARTLQGAGAGEARTLQRGSAGDAGTLPDGSVRESYTRGGEDSGRRVHLLDDGFQHRQLYRDVDILLLNQEDWRDGLLPAGNLREPRSAAKRANVIVIPENEGELESELRAWGWRGPVWRVRRRMNVPQVEGPVLGFCGIARPEQFFAGLEAAGLRVAGRIAFRDHHRYSAEDVERLQSFARAAGASALITTPKDEVRLRDGTAEMDKEAGGGRWFPTLLAKDAKRMGHGEIVDAAGFPYLTAGLRIEIVDESTALDWLASRLGDISARLSV